MEPTTVEPTSRAPLKVRWWPGPPLRPGGITGGGGPGEGPPLRPRGVTGGGGPGEGSEGEALKEEEEEDHGTGDPDVGKL